MLIECAAWNYALIDLPSRPHAPQTSGASAAALIPVNTVVMQLCLAREMMDRGGRVPLVGHDAKHL